MNAAVRHGTISAYRNHGCRCEECRAVQREYNARNRAARKAAGAFNHGTRSAYDAGCRCRRCRNRRRVAYITGAGEYQPKTGLRRMNTTVAPRLPASPSPVEPGRPPN